MDPVGRRQPKLVSLLCTIFIVQVMDRAVRMYLDRVTELLDMLQETEEEERLVDARCQGDSQAEDIFAPPDTNGDTNGALHTHQMVCRVCGVCSRFSSVLPMIECVVDSHPYPQGSNDFRFIF